MLRPSVVVPKLTIQNFAGIVARHGHSQQALADKCHHYNEVEGHYRSSPFEPVQIPRMKIHEYVWQNLPNYEKSIAVVSLNISELEVYIPIICRQNGILFMIKITTSGEHFNRLLD